MDSTDTVRRHLEREEEYRVRDTDGDRDRITTVAGERMLVGLTDYDSLPPDRIGFCRRQIIAIEAEAALLARPVEPDARVEAGRRLAELRHAAGLTLRGAAAATGLDFTYLSKIEHDHDRPGEDAIRRLAAAYHADGEELLHLFDRRPTRAELQARVAELEARALLARRAPGDRGLREAVQTLLRHVNEADDQSPPYHLIPVEAGDIAALGRALRADSRPEQPDPESGDIWPKGRGCPACDGTGFVSDEQADAALAANAEMRVNLRDVDRVAFGLDSRPEEPPE